MRKKSQEAAVAKYNHDKASRQDSVAFPATVSASIKFISSTDSYNQCSPSKTYGRCSLTHNSSGHCSASSTKYDTCGGLTTDSAQPAHHLPLSPKEETTDQVPTEKPQRSTKSEVLWCHRKLYAIPKSLCKDVSQQPHC